MRKVLPETWELLKIYSFLLPAPSDKGKAKSKGDLSKFKESPFDLKFLVYSQPSKI